MRELKFFFLPSSEALPTILIPGHSRHHSCQVACSCLWFQ